MCSERTGNCINYNMDLKSENVSEIASDSEGVENNTDQQSTYIRTIVALIPTSSRIFSSIRSIKIKIECDFHKRGMIIPSCQSNPVAETSGAYSSSRYVTCNKRVCLSLTIPIC